jgi:hypothetical protein
MQKVRLARADQGEREMTDSEIADLYLDYSEFLEFGRIPKNRFHALVVQELLEKQISLGELKEFQDRRANMVKAVLGEKS